MADMTLSADINADVSGFTSGVSKAEGSLSGFQSKCRKAGEDAEEAGKKSEDGGKGVKGFGDKCKDAAGGASTFSSKVSALTVAAGNLIASLAGKAIDYVASLAGEMVEASDSAQKFASTLSFAGIDTATIDKLTKSTQAYADATVYDLADIRNVTAQLAANGVADYERLAQAAGNLNAVAGGNADTFRSVAMVMTQTAGAGKLTTENWNQLSDAIPGASGALQQAMKDAGAFEGNFREAMEKGQISAEEFNAAVMKLGMQDVAVQAATSTSTIEGAVGNLEAAIVGVGSQAITALNPFITGTLVQLTNGISQLPALFESLIPVLAPVGEAFSAAFSTVAPAVLSLVETIGPALLPLLQQILTVVTGLAPVIATVVSAVLGAASQIAEVVIPILTQIFAFVSEHMPQIQAIVTGAMQVIQEVIGAACNAIQQVWDRVWPAIQTVVETVMGVIQGVIDTVLGIINGNWDQVWTGIQTIAQSISDGICGIVEWAINLVAEFIGDVLSTIQGVWDSVWGAISDFLGGIWDGICGIVDGAVGSVSDAIDGALSWIQDAWSGAWDAVSSFLSDCWDGMTDTLSGAIDGVVDFFSDLPGNILNALGNVGGLLIDAGRSIIDGLWNGLKDAAGGMFSWVGGIADTIASLKGPLPYDRKVLVPAGNALMEGLLRSMQAGFREVRDEAASMAPALAGEFASGIGVVPVRFDASGTAASVALGTVERASYGSQGGAATGAPTGDRYVVNINGAEISADGHMAALVEELVSCAVRSSRARRPRRGD